MTTTEADQGRTPNKYSIPLLLTLIAAGLAGNYFKYPIFLNIDFLFGSIFAMLALQFLGVGRGIVAAAMIAGYTYILWNHPYAIIIMTAEVASVGWLMSRQKMGMVLSDTLYWLVIGMPLVYLFYHVAMHVPPSNTYIVMTKQAVNGIANALVARLIFTGYVLRTRSSLMSYREIIYNLFIFFILMPALATLAFSSRADFAATDKQIKVTLLHAIKTERLFLDIWLEHRKQPIVELANIAKTNSPQQMQALLEQAKRSADFYDRLGFVNKEAISLAFAPRIDESGKSTIGIDLSDRPYVPVIKQALKPMLSDVFMGKIGISKPRVLMMAPVMNKGRYNGFLFGVLGLEQIQSSLEINMSRDASLYTLLDSNGNVIMTNRTEQKVMTPFERGKGTLAPVDKEISQWIPALPPNTPVSERWKKSYYVAETTLGGMAGWKLVLEQPVAPFQKALYDSYTSRLSMLFLLLLAAMALAEYLSRRFIVTIEKLVHITQDFPDKLTTGRKDIEWPESGIQEPHDLIANFSKMADLLAKQFNETRRINESLEEQVAQRTNELNILLENAPVGISKIVDRVQVWVNQKTTELFLYSPEEITNQPTRAIYPSDEAYEQFSQQAYPVLAQGDMFITIQELVKKDGEHFLVRCIGKAIDPQDMSRGTLWILEDVTERIKYEEELLQAKAAAESANRAKSEFLANMSHEIRTPMNGLLGMTQLLEMTDLTHEQQNYVTLLKLSGNNLVSLVNDILDLSKIEAGKIVIESVEFDLRRAINEVYMMQKSFIFEKKLAFDITVDEEIPSSLIGDQLRVKQITLNLLGNAAKFTKSGGITITAKVLERHHGSLVIQISVADTGIGISAEALEKIFNPFVQEDGSTTRQFGGTGLGLTISRRLAEFMGGNISVESTQGVGSSFMLKLPLTIPTMTDTTEPKAPITMPAWDGPSLRVLLVEDNPINMKFGTVLLGKHGHEVVTAANGTESLEALDQGTFDLVLMDIQMPVMNGEETLRAIRSKEQGASSHQRVIALTAHALRGEKDRFLEGGFDGYLSKPMLAKELVAEMKRVMNL